MRKSFWSLLMMATLLSACASGSGEQAAADNGGDLTEKNLPMTRQPPSAVETESKLHSLPEDSKSGEVTGYWSQILPSERRFKVVLNGEGILDGETGLVWERRPEITDLKWVDAMRTCYQLFKGDRRGWRPPSIEELASLADSNGALPKDAPFQNSVSPAAWWSSTSGLSDANLAFVYMEGWGLGDSKDKAKETAKVWCVRGGRVSNY